MDAADRHRQRQGDPPRYRGDATSASPSRLTGITCTFVRNEPQRPGLNLLYQVPTLGGTPRLLITDVDSAVSFAPDGKRFVFLRDSGADANSKLIIANADGSNERVLATASLARL